MVGVTLNEGFLDVFGHYHMFMSLFFLMVSLTGITSALGLPRSFFSKMRQSK